MKIEIEKIARSPSRSGRQLQRYNLDRRQVVGCIPYRYTRNTYPSSMADDIEVLLISSQKCETMMFPKGGWEADESMEEAVLREALEEAGITGTIQSDLGVWIYQSKSQDKMHDGHMFALYVDQEYEEWPEKEVRKRQWVTVEEAKRLCPYSWMNEALDTLIEKLPSLEPSSTSLSSPCSMEAQHQHQHKLNRKEADVSSRHRRMSTRPQLTMNFRDYCEIRA